MIHIRVISLEGRKLIDSFPEGFIAPLEEDSAKKDWRYFRKNLEVGKFELLLIREDRISYTNKVFKPFADALGEILLRSILNSSKLAHEIADDYLHNFTKIHSNQKSIIERCVNRAENQPSYNDFVLAVQNSLLKTPGDFAEDICALSKEVRLVDYHIGGYKLLNDATQKITITHNHKLKKFLLGLSHLFFESLRKKNVVLSLHDIDENFKCSFEYETFGIAMHSFLENTVKYSKPHSSARAYTDIASGELIFEMMSIKIENDELNTILERGISGKNIPEDIRGDGIGMYQLDTALKRSLISFQIITNHSEISQVNGIEYTQNIFKFKFNTCHTS